MSAYAVSFASYLPSVTSPSTKDVHHNPQQDAKKIKQCDNNTVVSHNEPLSAVHVEVKSAMIDAGALVRPSRRNSNNNSAAKKNYFSLPDDAVIFKLSINFNGRQYNASRSFDKFVTFRRDLLKELKYLNGTRNAMNNKHAMNSDVHNKESSSALTLPTLPECISDQPNIHLGLPKMSSISNMALAAAASNRLSGFTKLQSLLLCYYCPLMQCWLKQVINAMDVDTSTSLNNFLWEPLRDNNYDDDDISVPSVMSSLTVSTSSTSSHKSSIGSVMSLSSIHEDYDNDFDDSDCE